VLLWNRGWTHIGLSHIVSVLPSCGSKHLSNWLLVVERGRNLLTEIS
jgi:hypothetical protein